MKKKLKCPYGYHCTAPMESGPFNVYCYMENDVDVANTTNCNGIKQKSQNQAVTMNRYNSEARELNHRCKIYQEEQELEHNLN